MRNVLVYILNPFSEFKRMCDVIVLYLWVRVDSEGASFVTADFKASQWQECVFNCPVIST